MKAIVWTAFGAPEVLVLQEVAKPTPQDNQVLIKVFAATVTMGDCEIRSMRLPLVLRLPMQLYVGFGKPKRITILGQELAGEIEAVGKDVKSFQVGDQIFAASGLEAGAYAEYTCLSENAVMALKPKNMTFAQAATMPMGGLEAAHFLRKANLQRGQKILILGAGGSIGTIAVQLAKSYGAHVTAIDRAEKLDMLRVLGADLVIDYARADFTVGSERYDVIFDVVGKGSISRSRKVLAKNGLYLSANPNAPQLVQGLWARLTSRTRVVFGAGNQNRANLILLQELIEDGKINTVIDRQYPLEQTVEAHRYVETGLKKGNVVIAVRGESE